MVQSRYFWRVQRTGGLKVPLNTLQLFPNDWAMLLQIVWQFRDSHPIDSSTAFVPLDSANACSQFFRSQTSAISCSLLTMLSALRVAISALVPSAESLGASLLLISVEGQL